MVPSGGGGNAYTFQMTKSGRKLRAALQFRVKFLELFAAI
jgi:hypothetical protein